MTGMSLAAITITLGWWLIPAVITVVMFVKMFRPIEHEGLASVIEVWVRVYWLIPIFAAWLMYFIIMWSLK